MDLIEVTSTIDQHDNLGENNMCDFCNVELFDQKCPGHCVGDFVDGECADADCGCDGYGCEYCDDVKMRSSEMASSVRGSGDGDGSQGAALVASEGSEDAANAQPEAELDPCDEIWRCATCSWEVETNDGLRGFCRGGHDFNLTLIEGWFPADVPSEYEDEDEMEGGWDSDDVLVGDDGEDVFPDAAGAVGVGEDDEGGSGGIGGEKDGFEQVDGEKDGEEVNLIDDGRIDMAMKRMEEESGEKTEPGDKIKS